MAHIINKFFLRLLVVVVFYFYCIPVPDAQKLFSYGPEEPTAFVHYSDFLFGIYKNYYKKLRAFPLKGAYTPTRWAMKSHDMGTGSCNYIYIPTNGTLIPGHQYRLSITVKFGKAYEQMPYFQKHFGVAASSDLDKNYMGLLSKHFVPLNIKSTEELVTADFIFRPLCNSKYLILGVFQGPTMDDQNCFACQYWFELYDLKVENYDDPQADFIYMCDAFEEQRIQKKFSMAFHTDTVYFESGSAEIQRKYLSILDSLPSKLRTKQDLVSIYAYTDRAGSNNDELGAARNAAVRDSLIKRGIDTSRILMVNYGESRSSSRVLPEDRKVEIDVNRGKLFQKYYTEALQAVAQGDYKVAKTKINYWIKMAPPENSIYALFDCWSEGENSNIFRSDLLKNVRARPYYKGKNLKFTLDSLLCEDQRGRTLPVLLSMNHLPDYYSECNPGSDSLGNLRHQTVVDRIHSEHGFPTVKEFGNRCNTVLPYMILHAEDTSFQMRYLPIIQKACEEQHISWEYYAMLYDKISIERNGRQRYGTQFMIDKDGKLSGLYPFEDEQRIAEYRKQVGLVPLSDEPYLSED